AVDGPSGNVHWKLPPPALTESDPRASVPLFVAPASQSGYPESTVKVSCPGSLTVNEYGCVDPSSTLVAPVRLTVGATLLTVTVCVARLPVAPSESVAEAETIELA